MELVSTITNTKTTEERTRVQTNINNVNIDCLEEIFKYLNLKDLLNIGDSSKRLRKAASFIFACTYQPKIHIIHSIFYGWRIKYYQSWNNTADSEIMEKLEKSQKLHTLKTCLQLLRCFGNRITFLDITYNASTDCRKKFSESYITAYKRLVSHVNEYCYESLKTIKTYGCPQGAFDQMKKPFLKVESFITSACILKTNLWNTLFPQLRNLDYNHYSETITGNRKLISEYIPSYGIDNKFPHLEELAVNGEKKLFVPYCT